jgi:ribosome-binding protein aMBF1 (putative translation factor)
MFDESYAKVFLVTIGPSGAAQTIGFPDADRRIWQVPHVPPKKDSEPSREQLGAAIRSLRKDKGLSQKQLAERAGLHLSYLSGVENGARNPTWTVLGQMAEALQVKLVKLVEQAERE